ncbi:sigma-70 family RNA polymerase sigma factor [Streptomyces sp. IB201691-2A2]|nr:sigma-70 family RNA polymerase sigma factor [Streptomyces sp. IB201691-2A2]
MLDAEFTQFVTETEAKLYWYAYRLCGNRTQAEDLVQSAYLKLWGKWTDYRPSPSGRVSGRVSGIGWVSAGWGAGCLVMEVVVGRSAVMG